MKQKTQNIRFNVSGETQNKKQISFLKFFSNIAYIALITVAGYSSILTFLYMIDYAIYQNELLILMIFTSTVTFAGHYFIKKSYIINILIILILGILVTLQFDLVVSLFGNLFYKAQYAIFTSMGWSTSTLSFLNNYYISEANFILILIAILLVYINFLSYFIFKKSNFIGVFLLTFPFFEVGAAFGLQTNHIAFAGMLGVWVSMLILHRANRVKVKTKTKFDNKTTKAKKVYKNVDKQKFVLISCVVGLAIFIVFSSSLGLLIDSNYFENLNLSEVRNNVIIKSSDYIDVLMNKSSNALLPDGKLYRLQDRIAKKIKVMKIKAPNFNEPIYIRGFVGGEYNGREWLSSKPNDYYQSIFDDLKENNMSVSTLQLDSIKNLEKSKSDYYYGKDIIFDDSYYYGDVSSYFSVNKLTFSDLKYPKDYAYLPYFSILPNGIIGADDSYLFLKDEKKEKYSVHSFCNWSALINHNNQDYIVYKDDITIKAFFEIYNQYVAQNYTKVPQLSQEIKDIASSLKATTKEKSIKNVRNFLAENKVFSFKTKQLPKNKDFVEFFLEEGNTGYSPHFATTAAVLLREMGIPTRYVEGFLLDETAYKRYFANSNEVEFDVTDNNSHAWIEVYFEDVGWIPIETLSENVSVDRTLDALANLENQNRPSTTKPNSTVPATTSDSNSGQQNNTQPPVNLNKNNNKFNLLNTLLILFIVSLIVLVLFHLRRKLVLKKFNNKLLKLSSKDKALIYFKRLVEIIEFESKESLNLGLDDRLIDLIKSKSKILSLEEFEDFLSLLIKTSYSQNEISEEELNLIKKSIDEYSKKLYLTFTNKEKMEFKFLKVLI